MKASEVIPVFLKDKTLIASLGLIEGLHISMSSLSLPLSLPLPFLSPLSLFFLLMKEVWTIKLKNKNKKDSCPYRALDLIP